MRAMTHGLAAAVVVVLSACGLTLNKAEQRAYRAIVLAAETSEMTAATRAYLEAYPTGHYADALRASYLEDENFAYEEVVEDARLAEDYLAAYPDGRHADEVRARLGGLQATVESRNRSVQAAETVRSERRAETLQERREFPERAIRYWMRALADVGREGSIPIAQAAAQYPEFHEAFARSSPRCSHSECLIAFETSFLVPVPGQSSVHRPFVIAVRLLFVGAEQRLVRAELLLPGRGFSRWYEAAESVFVEDNDVAQRNQVLDWAKTRLEPMLSESEVLATSHVTILPSHEPVSAPLEAGPFQVERTETPEVLLTRGTARRSLAVAAASDGSTDAIVFEFAEAMPAPHHPPS